MATLAVTATLAIPPARAAVTNFLEVGAVRVHEGAPPGGHATAGPLRLGELSTLDAARARMPAVVPAARGFASPDEVWFEGTAGGVASLVYHAGPGLPAAKNTDGIGLLIQEFTGDGSGFLHKYLTNGSHAQQVAVGPYDGVFITGGDHFLAYDTATGEGATADGRLVGNAPGVPAGGSHDPHRRRPPPRADGRDRRVAALTRRSPTPPRPAPAAGARYPTGAGGG